MVIHGIKFINRIVLAKQHRQGLFKKHVHDIENLIWIRHPKISMKNTMSPETRSSKPKGYQPHYSFWCSNIWIFKGQCRSFVLTMICQWQSPVSRVSVPSFILRIKTTSLWWMQKISEKTFIRYCVTILDFPAKFSTHA